MSDAEFTLSKAEWRERLSKDAYRVLREQGTEPRFSGEHVDRSEDGVYRCVGCGAELFTSDTKYDSHCGWPSFYAANDSSIELRRDLSHGMDRTEVVCSTCGGHLGHVFDDGPQPTGKRYCINSVVLDFEPESDE
ncbi:peptide-methionine (R)-S-oxide reductase MsrB [Haloferax sp. MBLA0076]|uniref:peptide-methionine (R)-S-oxide reductase n=1 Tax=Haloferax litoreum TaxID=2666140 RepID=A0A6A8GGB0_9EURY|nr:MULTISPECIES: peptide-methionine (R)-S-oxide reductase MsrB [Haloferax]KAB1193326.1 peptide-methionine (R)-S-oxide reductase MsrB [Haloferax sp. CBA1148]MRX21831.1 peptide-methionine (R)-S-oxide reductase MsrB [Haloferax litoreum]